VARGADENASWPWFGEGAAGAPGQGTAGSGAVGDRSGWFGEEQTVVVPQEPTGASRGPSEPAPSPREPYGGTPPPGSAQPVMGQPPPSPRPGDPHQQPYGQGPPPWPQADAETAMIPRVAYYETAILPKAVDGPTAPPTLAEMAARHGLKPAGTRPTLGEYTRRIWRYREFITFYASARQAATVASARLGRLWIVLTPLLNAAVYFVIFGIVLNLGRDIPNFIGYLTIGFFVYSFTQSVAQAGVVSISGQIGLVRALQFPRASLPIAAVIMQLRNFVISVVVLLGIVLATGEPVTSRWPWVLPALALQTVFNVGLACGLARIGARIADARQVLPVLLRIWMYLSGVFYSVTIYEQMPSAVTTIVHWNPLLTYIELMRWSLLTEPPLTSAFAELWLKGVVWAAVMAFIGYWLVWRGEGEYGRG